MKNGRDVPELDAIARDVESRIAALQWPSIEAELDAHGAAIVPSLITPDECHHLTALYDDDNMFRSRVVMARHGFGRGEYRYFRYPLPPLIAALRAAVYPRLVPLAERWHEAMGLPARFPSRHDDWIQRCHAAGQARPTPLLLRYRSGDYNCLHQDVYGEHVFPLQLVLLLSQPGRDFVGGEFVMTEQRPRMQTRPMVLALQRGDGALIAVRQRPVRGARGFYRVNLRHGVARVRGGERLTAGVIFHDAA
jgi:uncharacterized protein